MRNIKNNSKTAEPSYENEEREKERKRRCCIVQFMPTAGKPGVKKTGFVYADAQTVYLARLSSYTFFS